MSNNVVHSDEYQDSKGRKIDLNIVRAEGFLFGKWICECGHRGEGSKAFQEIDDALTFVKENVETHICK